MEFLQAVIENLSLDYKNFYYRWWLFESFFTNPYITCQTLALNSKPNNLNKISEFFIFAIVEILTSDLDTRPKIGVLIKNLKNLKFFKFFNEFRNSDFGFGY